MVKQETLIELAVVMGMVIAGFIHVIPEEMVEKLIAVVQNIFYVSLVLFVLMTIPLCQILLID